METGDPSHLTEYMKKEIKFITGGCGFVGRHLAKNLLAEDSEVWVLDNLSAGKSPEHWLGGYGARQEGAAVVYERAGKRLVFIQQDAIDFFRSQLSESSALSLPRFDEVYHLAAIVGGRAVLIENDPLAVAVNHCIDSLFFQWAARHQDRVGSILYASTSVSYPRVLQTRRQHIAMREEYIALRGNGRVGLPESIYGWIKLAGEYLGMIAHDHYGLSVVSVRPFSGYGEDQDSDYPIPAIAARAAVRVDPLLVWGSGDQGRDFIYIDDFVAALRIAIRKIHDGSGINIGTGALTTFREVAQIMAELAGYSPKIKGLAEKAEGSFAVYADVSLLRSLGWQPRYTVRQGLARVFKRVETMLEKGKE